MIVNKNNPKKANTNEIDPIKRSKLADLFRYIRSFIPLLLSHHPECEEFKDHTLNIGKMRLCIGCFIGYPSGIIGIFLLFYSKLVFIISSQILITIGIILLSTFLLSPLKLIRNKKLKIIQKIIIGFGGAFLFWGIRNLPYPQNVRILIFNYTFGGLLSILNLYHAYGFFSHCYRCQISFNWGMCSGFITIQNSFKKYNLNNFLLLMNDFSNSMKMRRDRKKSSLFSNNHKKER